MRRGLAAVLAALTLTGVATTASADPVFVYLNPIIVWSTPFPFLPSTVSGEWNVSSSQPYGPSGRFTFIGLDPTSGPIQELRGPYVVEPGTTLYWSFSGVLAVDGGNGILPMCAYADFTTPVAPCNVYTPPMIELGVFVSQDFLFNLSGAIFAFNGEEPVQVGKWSIGTDSRWIPEPGTLLLAGVAMAALALQRRGAPAARSAS